MLCIGPSNIVRKQVERNLKCHLNLKHLELGFNHGQRDLCLFAQGRGSTTCRTGGGIFSSQSVQNDDERCHVLVARRQIKVLSCLIWIDQLFMVLCLHFL